MPPDGETRTLEQRNALSVGDPGPFSLFAFAIGTIVIAVVLSGLEPMTSIPAVIPSVLFVAGIGQFIGGLFAYGKGDTFSATAFCLYGANNVLVASFFWMVSRGLSVATGPQMLLLGMGEFVVAYASLALAVAALRLNWTLVGITSALVLGYALPAVTDVGGLPVVGHIGGYFLFLAALLALYAATAMLVNSTWQRSVIALGSLRKT
ncbi:MAG: acetate uptake transporter [Candidatus Eremiobacteraeota bacterium]|nr:acetate uptake transporter [Candidatus Eremiobacteraeota bacterium]